MNMGLQLDLEIRDQLARYLAGETDLRAFWNWFDAATWHVEQTGTPAAQELASEIGLRLAEFSNGHWIEKELRARLASLLHVYVLTGQSWGQPGQQIHTSSQNVSIPVGITVARTEDLGSHADIQFSVECA